MNDKTIIQNADSHSVSQTKTNSKTRSTVIASKSVQDLIKERVQDRDQLHRVRDKYKQDFLKTEPESVANITEGLSAEYRRLLYKMLKQESKKLGTPPCDFSAFLTGSLARNESGLITDAEMGFVIEKETKETKAYFSKLFQKMADRIYLMGEHPDVGVKGFRLDEADNAPPYERFQYRYMNKDNQKQLIEKALLERDDTLIPTAGSKMMVGTPQAMGAILGGAFLKAGHRFGVDSHSTQTTHFLENISTHDKKVLKDLPEQGRNIRKVYGSTRLYKKMIEEQTKHLDKIEPGTKLSVRQHLAVNCLKETIDNAISHKRLEHLETGKLGDTLEIKRGLYRLPEQVFTDLNFYYNLGATSTLDAIDKCLEKKIITQEQHSAYQDLFKKMTHLRLKEQSILGAQNKAIYLNHDTWLKDKQVIQSNAIVLNRQIKFYEQINDQNKVSALKDKLCEINEKMRMHEKLAPGKVLSNQDILDIESKYIPILKDLVKASAIWLANPEQGKLYDDSMFSPDASNNALSDVSKGTIQPRVPLVLGPEFDDLKKIVGQVVQDRQALKAIRDKHEVLHNQLVGHSANNYSQLNESVSKEASDWIAKLFKEEEQKLGPPPSPYTVFASGSLARQEAGIYTDLELGLIVEKKDYASKRYCDRLVQNVSNRLYRLGEHPDVGGKGMRMDEEDNSPIHLKYEFDRASTTEMRKAIAEDAFEGSRTFFVTPDEFAQNFAGLVPKATSADVKNAQVRIAAEKNALSRERARLQEIAPKDGDDHLDYHLQTIHAPLTAAEHKKAANSIQFGRNLSYVHGDENLYKKALGKRDKLLMTHVSAHPSKVENKRQAYALEKLKKDIDVTKKDAFKAIRDGKLEGQMDIKRQLYRTAEQVFTNLNFYYNFGRADNKSVIQDCVKNKLITPQMGQKYSALYDFLNELRVTKQLKLRGQGSKIAMDDKAYEEKLLDAKNVIVQRKAELQDAQEKFRLQPDAKLYLELCEKEHALTKAELDLRKVPKLKASNMLSEKQLSALEQIHLPVLNDLIDFADKWLQAPPALKKPVLFSQDATKLTQKAVAEDTVDIENMENSHPNQASGNQIRRTSPRVG